MFCNSEMDCIKKLQSCLFNLTLRSLSMERLFSANDLAVCLRRCLIMTCIAVGRPEMDFFVVVETRLGVARPPANG